MGVGYWDHRATKHVDVDGERFYTVSPIPYYVRRREVCLELLTPIVGAPHVENVCDFGCGDGWYLDYFARRYPEKRWWGIDSSQVMIERARSACPEAHLSVSDAGIQIDQQFDVVYALSVLAHVLSDSDVRSLLESIATHMAPGGKLVLFERTGPGRQNGAVACVRQTADYVRMASEVGFELGNDYLVRFPAHSVFAKWIARPWRLMLAPAASNTERRLRANRSRLFRAASRAAVCMTRNPVHPNDGTHGGNSFYEFGLRRS
jgi:SAM-dependent methyltransferase